MTQDRGYYVVVGTAVAEGGSAVIRNRDEGWSLPLTDASLAMVRAVTAADPDMFENADFWLPLPVAAISTEAAEAAGMISTGLNLNDAEAT
jgi:hypothetical protein